MNVVLHRDHAGDPSVVRTTIFDATDRRRYEKALLEASRREHEIAHQLQQSLLSATLPTADGFELGVTYHPGVAGLDVGGDWYDAFWLKPGETLALVVGDVVGRGIEAAATMGQLRSAVRALASTGLEPAAVIAALNNYAARHDIGAMTTLIYAQTQLATGEIRFASAGHPPPLLMQPGSTPEYLWDGRSPPIDAIENTTQPLPEGRRTLPPGGVLLLYSDGLVEHPTRPLEDGMENLAQELAAHIDQPIAELTRSLVHRLRESSHSDDICLLALRLEN
jgi:serine/threonine-protein kinase RsbW